MGQDLKALQSSPVLPEMEGVLLTESIIRSQHLPELASTEVRYGGSYS